MQFEWARPPWQHQRAAFERAITMRDYALLMEMGTGKTFTAVNVLRWWCKHYGQLLRTLVLCPPIVCEAWKREFETSSKMAGDVLVLRGEGKKRVKRVRERCFTPGGAPLGAIVVTNYESLSIKELFQLFSVWRPQVLICDEAHKLKNPAAARTKLAIKLADFACHRMILTGSPILNDSMDVWSQFRVLDRGESFDKNFYAFRAAYFEDANRNMPKATHFPDWRPRPAIAGVFNAKIFAKATRVLKEECMDLPPLVRQQVDVEMGAEQARCYREMEADFIAYMKTEIQYRQGPSVDALEDRVAVKASVARLAITRLMRLQQIVAGHLKTEDGVVRRFADNPRLAAAVELVQEIVAQGHKVIVWAIFREDIAALGEALDKAGVAHCALVGGMTTTEQQAVIDAFQGEGGPAACLANQRAAGTGITLTAASYSLYYSKGYSLEDDMQSEARNYRGGSERHAKVTRIDLVCRGTVDETVMGALQAKVDLGVEILGGRTARLAASFVAS